MYREMCRVLTKKTLTNCLPYATFVKHNFMLPKTDVTTAIYSKTI